jgi:hypothetical protein
MVHLISIIRRTGILKFLFNLTPLSVADQCTCEALTQLNGKSRRAAYQKGDPKHYVNWNKDENWSKKIRLMGRTLLKDKKCI